VEGGGKMVVATRGGANWPGHFGHLILEKGVEKMSLHYEADLDQGGRSVLGFFRLFGKMAGLLQVKRFKEGTYEIESVRRGYALELAVDLVRMAGGPRGFGGQDKQ
jgi:arabinan endo-1,5-alpha-L-arabinosidase